MPLDQQDYWQGAGYSEIPDTSTEGYRAFDESQALGGDFSTPDFGYAPWAGGETFGVDYGEIDPYGAGTGGGAPGTPPTGGQTFNWGGGAAGALAGNVAGNAGAWAAGLSSSAFLGPLGFLGGGLIGGLMGGHSKKRGTPGWTDTPSYQGFQFEPSEGFPSYYETAQGTENPATQIADPSFEYQAPQQQGYDYDYTGGIAQPSGDLGQQGYVGQQEQEFGSYYNQNQGGIFDTFTV